MGEGLLPPSSHPAAALNQENGAHSGANVQELHQSSGIPTPTTPPPPRFVGQHGLPLRTTVTLVRCTAAGTETFGKFR